MDWLYWDKEAEWTSLRPAGEVETGADGGGLQGAQDSQNDVQIGESNNSLTVMFLILQLRVHVCILYMMCKSSLFASVFVAAAAVKSV